ncbi:hypothetical protein KDK_70390 [Dictyobacter kobayashii]|uniref:Uncharacterized protein n=2 Tax=Dictyobacter kobayashii TaxID=2014872 RepID=A0A402AVY2_9CHLR|nr:hypothetical protein KDK_70390 [Dictyobacter kobayashii]
MDIITIINPDEQRQSMVQFSGGTEWQITTYGIDNLWNELMNTYDIFERLGKPHASEYKLVVTDNAARLTIQTLELSV